MSPGVTFERVYRGLKERLGSGDYAAGEHLDPAALSDDLNSSITPVRDALHRLVGEGLAEAPRGDGFRTPLVTEAGLRHLYRWNAALLDMATRARRLRPVGGTRMPEAFEDPMARIEMLFLAMAERAGNPEHVAAVARLNERLRPARRAELALEIGGPDEERDLAGHLPGQTPAALRRAVLAYHRRRERLAADIVECLHRAP